MAIEMTRTQTRLQELERRNAEALEGGGADKAAKHRLGKDGAVTRLTARERLDVLLDPGRV